MNKLKSQPRTVYTYGVYGIMEWQALIPTLDCMVRVPFTGGSLTGYGVRPATFSTDNAVLAHFIEASRYFRTGRIRKLSQR